MSNPTLPGTSGLISNATARLIIGNIFAWATFVILAVIGVDAILTTVDVGFITDPALKIDGVLFALFQATSTSPNVPTPKRLAAAPATVVVPPKR